MATEPEIRRCGAEPKTILSVSPHEADHNSLETIFEHSSWHVLRADNALDALLLLDRHDISVVLCERDLRQGRWTDVLEYIQTLACPPSLIVTSRAADIQLWAEALNLGAQDVLAKPYYAREVVRSIKLAWAQWYSQKERIMRSRRLAKAAS